VALAQVCYKILGFSNIREALNDKQDLHLRLAGRFLGVTYERAQELKRLKDAGLGASRQSAKPVNFGVPGLMGPERLADAAHAGFTFFCELSGRRRPGECHGSSCRECQTLAKGYIKDYHHEWPEVKEYHKYILNHTSDPFPAPLTGFLRGKVKGSEACNFPFQHLTSRMAKSALMTVSKECYTNRQSPAYGSRPWGFAHDEILAEVPADRAPEAADEICRLMLKAAQPWVPDVYLTAEPALMTRWWKGAECVRDSNGRLQVWEPKAT
jgi:DNA polymerase I-like protein with 3'-5' exonuclease and polymerase domains